MRENSHSSRRDLATPMNLRMRGGADDQRYRQNWCANAGKIVRKRPSHDRARHKTQMYG